MEQLNDHRIPVTILTGFLGAGKTTLLNRLIKEYPDKKFAIIENEFGEINIDSELVVGADGENVFELSNGCICCTLNDDLYKVLGQLLASEKPFNHLLIESTGIADPSSIIQPFIGQYEIQLQFRLDSLVCMVDSEIIEEVLDEEKEAMRQIALADVLIMNKKSNVHPEYFKELTHKLRHINAMADMITTDYAEIKGFDVLHRQAMSPGKTEAYIEEVFSKQRAPAHSDHDCHEGCGCDHAHHAHHARHHVVQQHAVQSHSFVVKGQMDYERFSLWMDYFLTFNQHSIYRIKGILSFADASQKMVAQSVKTSFLMVEGKPWLENEQRQNKLVFIGKYLDEEAIRENLESFVIRD